MATGHLLSGANSMQALRSPSASTGAPVSTHDGRVPDTRAHLQQVPAPTAAPARYSSGRPSGAVYLDAGEPLSPENEAARRQRQESDTIHLHALSQLRKNSFNCTILGARQTGKRSIVVCFVKLLDEFKLAAHEYKKEKMLTKLVECSERLHELAARQEDEHEQEELAIAQQRQRRTSRLNSWLPSGGAVKSLLNLSPVGKRRLHSVANLWTGGGGGTRGVVENPVAEMSASARNLRVTDDRMGELLLTDRSPAPSNSSPASHRRHTTFERPKLHVATTSSDNLAGAAAAANASTVFPELSGCGSSARYLEVQATNLTSCNNNKSDTNINYSDAPSAMSTGVTNRQEIRHHSTVHQLQVPTQSAAALRKHSDPTTSRTKRASILVVDSRSRSPSCTTSGRVSPRSSGSVFIQSSGPVNESRRNSSVRIGRGSTLATNNYLTVDASHQDQRPRRRSRINSRAVNEVDLARRLQARTRKQSMICLSRRSKRILLSLKELNRRKFAVKFSSRRQISDTFLHQVTVEPREGEPVGSRRRMLLQLAHTSALADSFIVVYAINDRDSFEYARSLIKQLRSRQLDIPIPIVLVANKSDLERNREVKSEDGRSLARSFACKFIEISCTIGFNLDNLLVGLRTQLVLRHHIILNSILRPGFRYQYRHQHVSFETDKTNRITPSNSRKESKSSESAQLMKKQRGEAKEKSGDNILVRLYKRYMMDNCDHNQYECDNFSKL